MCVSERERKIKGKRGRYSYMCAHERERYRRNNGEREKTRNEFLRDGRLNRWSDG